MGVQEQEQEWIIPFPKFGNGKGMKKTFPEFRNGKGTRKKTFLKFRNGKGIKNVPKLGGWEGNER